MSDYKTLRKVEFDGDCSLEMYSETCQYGSYPKQECITICYLTPTGDPDMPGYFSNNSEIYKISDLERANAAFDERIANEAWSHSSNVTFSNRGTFL